MSSSISFGDLLSTIDESVKPVTVYIGSQIKTVFASVDTTVEDFIKMITKCENVSKYQLHTEDGWLLENYSDHLGTYGYMAGNKVTFILSEKNLQNTSWQAPK